MFLLLDWARLLSWKFMVERTSSLSGQTYCEDGLVRSIKGYVSHITGSVTGMVEQHCTNYYDLVLDVLHLNTALL